MSRRLSCGGIVPGDVGRALGPFDIGFRADAVGCRAAMPSNQVATPGLAPKVVTKWAPASLSATTAAKFTASSSVCKKAVGVLP